MYVRLVRFTLMAGKQVVAQELADLLIPAIRSQAGCQSATFYADSDSGDCGLVVLWETKEEADAAAAVIGPRLQQGLSSNVQGPPDIRLFAAIEPAS